VTIVSPAEVQQWLHISRIVVTGQEDGFAEQDETARALVYGALGARYDTAQWTDSDHTPVLVRQVMSMLVAAWLYKKTFAESTSTSSSNYGVRLQNDANSLLDQLLSREVLLIDAPDGSELTSGAIAFFPTDVQEFDEMGNETKFGMGMIF
jgi:hypothetical protein